MRRLSLPLIIGLGNPGSNYAHTRHNVGFDTIDLSAAFFHKKLRKRCFRLYNQVSFTLSKEQVTFVQPLTYMNNSGKVAKYFIPKPFSVDNTIVVCDNLDLPVGEIRIRQGGGSAGHRGLASFMNELSSGDFIRIYIGIGRPSKGLSVIDHVLGRAEGDEKEALQKSIARAQQMIIRYIHGSSIQELANEFHSKHSH
ncbi:MAG: aminoacyl-tRNA hydrolase [Sphaerochaetaceae bacterium]